MTIVRQVAATAVAVAAATITTSVCLPVDPTSAAARPRASSITALTRGLNEVLPVDVLVDTLLPRVVRPHATVQLTGRLVSHAETPLTNVRVRLRVRNAAVSSRSELTATALRTTAVGIPVETTTSPVADLAPGGTVRFTIAVPADALKLGSFGVYPVAVEALADDLGGPNATVGRVPTFLPWVPARGGFRPTRIAWVVPLVDAPNRSATSTFADDHLAGSFSAGGRLATIVSAAAAVTPTAPQFRQPPAAQSSRPATTTSAATATTTSTTKPVPPPPERQRPVPVTYAIDPALAQSAADMSDGYDVAEGSGSNRKSTRGTGRAAAVAWLALLRDSLRSSAARPSLYMALPYADVDVSALGRANMDPDITAAMARGREIATSVLGAAPDSSIAWPAGGFITARALDDLVGVGIDRVILSESALPLTTPVSYTPDAGAKVDTTGGSIAADLYDATLNQITAAAGRSALANAGVTATPSPSGTLSPGPLPLVPTPTTGRLIEQRFLAETALITAERPVESRDVVIVTPRQWDPVPGLATALFADTGRVPWLTPITEPSVRRSDLARTGLTYPDSAAQAELPASYLTGPDGVVALRRSLATLRTILQPPAGPTAIALDYATLRTESAGWREDPVTGVALRDDVAAQLQQKRDAVSISSSRRLITLASRHGTIPITIVNDLDQAVVVRLKLRATSNARLSAPDTAPQTVAAGHKVTYEVKAVVNQAGLFPVTAQLLTPDRHPYGPEVTLRLRSTAYGQLAIGITGGALGVLLAAVLVRLLRRSRHARRNAATGAAGNT